MFIRNEEKSTELLYHISRYDSKYWKEELILIYRRMLRISWTEHMCNEEALKKIVTQNHKETLKITEGK